MNCVLAAARPHYAGMIRRLEQSTGHTFFFVDTPDKLTVDAIASLEPRYIFFPHWSWIIPESIWGKYECIIFHMTDLPFGRGGSPLQNLIVRGVYETQISALRCVQALDAGPVYLKRPLSLHGSAEEIYLRAGQIIEGMIEEIIMSSPVPQDQEGEAVFFCRRTPAQSDVGNLTELQKVFDYIRMLDAEGYPHAFLETRHLRLEFRRANLSADSIHADVCIRLRQPSKE